MINLFFNNKKAQSLALSGVLAFAVLGTTTSCKKDDDASSSNSASKAGAEKAIEVYKKAPAIDVFSGNEKFSTPNGVTYANAGEFSFSNTSGIEISASSNINFSEGPDGPVISLAPSGGSGGGTVQAGETSLTMDYAYCLSADDESLGFDADFMDLGFDGISFVVGIDGDFEEASEEDPEDIFNGMAIYYVFDDSPSGSYDVFNFTNLEEEGDEDDYFGSALAYVFDFKNSKIYMSASGTLNVSGGSVTFTGTYFEFDLDAAEGEGDDIVSFKEVNGLGTMGCE